MGIPQENSILGELLLLWNGETLFQVALYVTSFRPTQIKAFDFVQQKYI
jgi:hypothetical protein